MWFKSDGSVRYEMHEAARRGDVDAIPYLLGKGYNIDEEDQNGMSPLGLAACYRHPEMVSALLDYGAESDEKDGEGETPLDYAVSHGCVRSVLALINHGGDAHKKESRAVHALHKAAEMGKADVVKALLEEGMPVDSSDELHTGTALHRAATGHAWREDEEPRIQVVQLLLARGADVGARWKEWTPLALAARENRAEIVALLHAAGARMEITDAAAAGDTGTVRALLDRGENIESRDPYDQATPLLLAAGNGHADTVALLLSRGANIQATDDDYETALDKALDFERRDVALVLIEQGGAEPDQFALFRAITHGYRDIVELLLLRGAAVNAREIYDGENTPLMLACHKEQTEIVALLLAAGAEVDITNEMGYTALMLACEVGALEIVRLLLAAGADVHRHNVHYGTALSYATINEHAEVAALLRANGAQE